MFFVHSCIMNYELKSVSVWINEIFVTWEKVYLVFHLLRLIARTGLLWLTGLPKQCPSPPLVKRALLKKWLIFCNYVCERLHLTLYMSLVFHHTWENRAPHILNKFPFFLTVRKPALSSDVTARNLALLGASGGLFISRGLLLLFLFHLSLSSLPL